MLHLKFALNLEHLADKMIGEISSVWNNPFEAPVVIFPDPKLEQWFRLRWMKKKGVLANLNKSTIDRFLFQILVGDDCKLKKLSSEMLANVIMAYLLGKDDGENPNYMTLDSKVAEYLTKKEQAGSEERVLDEVRLYDFANKLAGLFLEYETSRPQGFLQAKGILDYWSEDVLRKSGKLDDFFVKKTWDKDAKESKNVPVDNESWEKTLYSKIFHNVNGDSLLTRVFAKADGEADENNKVKYLTLPFLYKECLDSKGEPQFKYNSKAPVFILGLSGMGQFYRIVLREFAKQHEVYAYIQNPCMEFWEDLDASAIVPKIVETREDDKITETEDTLSENENSLLRYWGKSGRDNIKLWCLTDDYSTCDFSEDEHLELLDETQESPKDLLHAVQYLVANRQNEFEDEMPEGHKFKKEDCDKSLTVTAAPSKLREVEALHSSICKLLLNGVHSNDILVVSPNLQEYSPFIYQIFDQAKNAAENGDESIVYVPYTIVDSISKDSLVGAAIKKLFLIRKEHSVSRSDFFDMVRNPVVQATRGITPDMVAIWDTWITDMNVYRDRPKQDFKPWQWAVKRMLLARLTTKTQKIDDSVYTPYANMNSTDDSLLVKFINAIEDLEQWTNAFKEGLAESNSETLLEMVNSWVNMKNVPNELTGERAAYFEVCKALNRLKYIFYAGTTETIPMEIVRESILEAATVSEFSFGSLFVNGISFMKFAPNRIIPVKHLFFLGADVDHFPSDDSFNTLDLRRQVRPWPGDDTSISRNRYAFLCQLMCTSESFHISYQNMNLAKDSEIYPSPIINDLKNFVAGFAEKQKDKLTGEELEPLHTEKIPLDETRSRDCLFTRRGRRYMESIECIRTNASETRKAPCSRNSSDSSITKYPDKVSISQMKQYLNDPFQFYVGRMLRLEKIENDPTEEYVEPISLSNLDEAIFLKQAVYIERGLDKDYESVDVYFDGLKSQGYIPSGKFGEGMSDKIKTRADAIKVELDSFFPENAYTCKSIELNECITDPDGSNSDSKRLEFMLQGNIPLVFSSKEKCAIVSVSNSDGLGAYKYLDSYIGALGLIAAGKAESVDLFIATGACQDDDAYEANVCRISKSPSEAMKTLCDIYKKAFKEQDNKILPISLLCSNITNTDYLKAKLVNDHGGAWTYFAGKDLFINELEKYSGYSNKSFADEWAKACEKQKDLLGELNNKIEGAV